MARTHDQLVDELIRDGVLRTPAIIEAFRAIDRRDFVPHELIEEAYRNVPLPLRAGQTISQPLTVAYMLELLQPQAGENILDVGFGSGWQTALLAHLVGEAGHVTALEIIPELWTWGQDNVAKYSFLEKGVVDMHCQSGLEGYPPRAPFDKIIAAAAGEAVPEAWLAQTKVGGRIVAPVGGSVLQLIKTSDSPPPGGWERHEHLGFAFVPLVGNHAGGQRRE
jgi:protein-L-isoaspartate(D-aspartate) O-methyltransferase